MKKYILLLLLSPLLVFAQESFITIINNTSLLDADQQRIFSNVQNYAAAEQPYVVKLNKDLLENNSFEIKLYNTNAKIIKDRVEKNGASSKSWFGHIENQIGGVNFVISEHGITGKITIGNQIFVIVPLGKNYNTLYKLNQSSYDEDCDGSGHNTSTTTTTSLANNILPASSTDCKVRILVMYTQAAETQLSNIGWNVRDAVKVAIDETNQSHQNSAVTHRVELVRLLETSYTEQTSDGTSSGCSSAMRSDRNRFRNTSDGIMDNVHTERDLYRADVCVLLSDPCRWCGVAYDIGIGTNSADAFCVVDWDCLMGYYSFGHEIGHLHGCRHDTYVDPTNTPYSYGHALVYVPGRWRTIMGYNTECSDQTPSVSCTRIQYWSNQTVNFGGVATGTASTEDNQRVLNVTAANAKAWRSIFTSQVLGDIILNGEYADAFANSTLSTNTSSGFTCNSGSEVLFKAGDNITLKTGFHAKSGSNFEAKIESCN